MGSECASVEMKLKDEKDRRKAWAIENVRRKHNYIPFIYNLLKVLAEKGKLDALREEGKKAMNDREKKKEADKKKKLKTKLRQKLRKQPRKKMRRRKARMGLIKVSFYSTYDNAYDSWSGL